MGLFILRRVGVMILTALCLTFVVFFLTNLYPNLEKLAKTQGNARMTDAEVASWLDRNGYGGPMILRYGQWLGVVPGWTSEDAEGTSSPGAASTAAWNRARRRASAGCCRAIWAIPPFPPTRWPPSSAAGCN
jgi:peptide/nickel transport system permease protein